jgi:uncharacterized membrane protein
LIPQLRWLSTVHLIWTVTGLITVVYLVYVELVLLNVTICEWCSGVHLLIIASFILCLIRWRQEAISRYAAY